MYHFRGDWSRHPASYATDSAIAFRFCNHFDLGGWQALRNLGRVLRFWVATTVPSSRIVLAVAKASTGLAPKGLRSVAPPTEYNEALFYWHS
jgi:hypothetical protein